MLYKDVVDSSTGGLMSALLMKNIFETAIWDYANVLPIHFIEVTDNGDPISEWVCLSLH